MLIKQDGVEGFGGRIESGQMHDLAIGPPQPRQRPLESSVPGRKVEQISKAGEDQRFLSRIVWTTSLVEYPGSTGMGKTLPPLCSTISRPAIQ